MKAIATIRNLVVPYSNRECAAFLLCQKLNVRATKFYIQQHLEEHLDYPFLLAVSDVLKNTGINNAAFETKLQDIEGLIHKYLMLCLPNRKPLQNQQMAWVLD